MLRKFFNEREKRRQQALLEPRLKSYFADWHWLGTVHVGVGHDGVHDFDVIVIDKPTENRKETQAVRKMLEEFVRKEVPGSNPKIYFINTDKTPLKPSGPPVD